MAAILYPIFALLLLLLWFRLGKYRKQSGRRAAGMLFLQVVIFLWIFNDLVLSIGQLLGEGDLLFRLSQARLILRNLFVPFLMITVWDFSQRVGIEWVQGRLFKTMLWLFAIIFFVLSGLQEWQLIEDMQLVEVMGTLQYHHTTDFPPFLQILTLLVMAILSILIWRKIKWPWVFLGIVVALVGILLPVSLVTPLTPAGLEILFVWAFVGTEKRLLTPDYSLSDSELDSRFNQVSTERKKKK